MALCRIRLNIGGHIFVTKKSTLDKMPGTKLANYSDTCEFFDSTTDEYYYDRNPFIFQSILDFYRTGRLHFQSNMCAEHIREEMEFWGISPCDLKPCCWKNFYSLDSEMQTADVIKKYFEEKCCSSQFPNKSFDCLKHKIWNFLENPRVSTYALIWHIVYMGMVSLAIALSLVQSFELTSSFDLSKNNSYHDVKERLTDGDSSLEVVTHICNVVFTLETSIRLFTCPKKKEFFRSFLNVIDVISCFGYFVFIIILLIPLSGKHSGKHFDSIFLFIYSLIILRGFRFFRLERFFEGLRLMLLSITQSKKMLMLLVVILLITSVIFGITIHVTELEVDDSGFKDPISCFYWAIITMTTIGYGDKYPKTSGGQFVASACATFGVFVLSMPVAVVANTFTDLYSRYTLQCSHFVTKKKQDSAKKNMHELVAVKY